MNSKWLEGGGDEAWTVTKWIDGCQADSKAD